MRIRFKTDPEVLKAILRAGGWIAPSEGESSAELTREQMRVVKARIKFR